MSSVVGFDEEILVKLTAASKAGLIGLPSLWRVKWQSQYQS